MELLRMRRSGLSTSNMRVSSLVECGAPASPPGRPGGVVRASLAGRMWAGLGQVNAPPVAGWEAGMPERLRVGEERPENPGKDPRGSPRGMPVEGGARQFNDSKATEVEPPVRSRTVENVDGGGVDPRYEATPPAIGRGLAARPDG